MNKVILIGNIGRSPQFGLTQDGKEIAKFFLATSTSWKAEDSEWHTHTEWHRITVFKESSIRWMKDVLKQGTTVYVEGKLSYHRWTDQYGQVRATPHIMITKHEGRVGFIKHSQARSFNPSSEEETSQREEDSLDPPEPICPSYTQQEKYS
ncbi:MAG TPA: hypothetical protein DER04_02055 [Holosporales bacterium]|nr:hypothetical protein [Holosporales bacterium]